MSAIAHVGSTSVVCGIQAEVCEPSALRPDHGFIVPNIELPALCSPTIRSGAPPPAAVEANAELQRLFTQCQLLDLRQLSIAGGCAVWCLWIDFVVLSLDGALWDATLTALSGALTQRMSAVLAMSCHVIYQLFSWWPIS